MVRRFFTKVDIDPSNPEARGVCDRCGLQFALSALHWQFQYTPGGLTNKKLVVCKTCRDEPSVFLKGSFLPPDPRPVMNARPEFYAIDEQSAFYLTAPGNRPINVYATSRIDVEISVGAWFAFFSATSGIATSLQIDKYLSAGFSSVSGITASMQLSSNISASITATTGISAVLYQVRSGGFILGGAALGQGALGDSEILVI